VEACLDFWLTAGDRARAFERRLSEFLGRRHCVLVNSGSSANLLAFGALTSPLLENPVRPGDEVITVAAAFPTTVNPIIQYGCVPVFVDIDPETVNIDTALLEKARSERTRAVMIAHTLGNPFDIDEVSAFCRRHDLFLVEDNCDALGSLYRGRKTGSFGHLSTHSFYPAHHITLGEGGAILTDDPLLHRIVVGLRDWGRDCRCEPGQDNACGMRFSGQFGTLPFGYDHKYVYSQIGYNLKALDIQAAIGLAQMEKLPSFVEARRRNREILKSAAAHVPWLRPQRTQKDALPSWFALLLVLAPDAPVKRNQVIEYLESNRIQTRLLFGGNLTRQPAYGGVRFRQIGDLAHTDDIMERAFFIGVYPGLSGAMLDYVSDILSGLREGIPAGADGAEHPVQE
ncbi:MAG: lipopolysaccharide biosynthesis protein RfbH, partial [Deltaproteobacteria bacterium]|nr:lipopolysaccharide biosynthesis protein RfbH [Deltaproteobacteria bacterium]